MATERMKMYKKSGITIIHELYYDVLSDRHAISVAVNAHKDMGLIGRYYCEVSTGYTFTVK